MIRILTLLSKIFFLLEDYFFIRKKSYFLVINQNENLNKSILQFINIGKYKKKI